MRERYEIMRRALLPLILLPLAGCGGSERATNTAADANAAAFVPPPVERPDALPGQANHIPLTAYVGKYPRDAISGVTFFDRTEVANALIAAVGDEKLRRLISSEGTQVPIFRAGDRIAAAGCEPHNCADRNWTFLVRADGTDAAACYHTAAMGGTSRWYANSAPTPRPGPCPSA